MSTKTKIYDTVCSEEFNYKNVQMKGLALIGEATANPTLQVEKTSGNYPMLQIETPSSNPNGSDKFISLVGNGSSFGTISGYTYGSNGSGISIMAGGQSDKDFAVFAAESRVENSEQGVDAKFKVNGYGVTYSTNSVSFIRSQENDAVLALDKEYGEHWIQFMSGSSSTSNTAEFHNNSNGDIEFLFRPTSGKSSIIKSTNGDLNLETNSSINFESSNEINFNSKCIFNSANGNTFIRDVSGGASSEPGVRIVNTTSGFFLECATSDDSQDRIGGIKYITPPSDYDSSGDFNYAFYSYRGVSGEYEAGESDSGLQFTSAAADFAEYFDIDRTYDWSVKSGDLHRETIIPEGYVVYVKDNIIHKDPVGTPMVTSENPLIAGNNKGTFCNMLSFSGQLKVFVSGTVKSGDLLIPDGNICIAKSIDEISLKEYINAIGRAAESSDDQGIKKVNCLIGVK